MKKNSMKSYAAKRDKQKTSYAPIASPSMASKKSVDIQLFWVMV